MFVPRDHAYTIKGKVVFFKLYLYIVYEIINEHLNTFVHENKVYFAVNAHYRQSDKSRNNRFTFYKGHFGMVILLKRKQ